MRGRRGASLVELCVALTLAAIVFAALTQALTGFRRMARNHADRIVLEEAWRIAGVVLPAELRALAPGSDVRAVGADSVSLRVFRGAAIVCGWRQGGVVVRYRGLRRPEPDKDSVVAVGTTAESAHPLLFSGTTDSGCTAGPDEEVMFWRGPPVGDTARLLLLFEPGSYHVAAGALRYRLGAAGRQPLTAEVFHRRTWVAPEMGAAGMSAVVFSLNPADTAGVLRPGARQRVALLNAASGATP